MVISNLDHVEVMSETVMVEGAGSYKSWKKKFKLDIDVAIATNESNVTQVALFSKGVTQVGLVDQFAYADA